jgi:glycosyltransferase involved in cell wall biosynthesis
MYGLPWVADFRDPWTQLATYSPATGVHAWLDRWLERSVLQSADIVIANTETNRRAILTAFSIDDRRICVLPNGFDPEDFPETERLDPPPRFTVSCLGNFYRMEDPTRFFRAFRRLVEQAPNVLLRLFGWHARAVRSALEAFVPPGNRERTPRISHGQAITAMRESTVLLGNVPSEAAIHWVPGKLYEYVAAGRPVLFIGPVNGDAARLLKEAGVGTTVSNDEEEIYRALQQLHDLWERGRLRVSANPAAIRRYSRVSQVERLADIFSRVAEGGPRHFAR